jgi:hypothetical protein
MIEQLRIYSIDPNLQKEFDYRFKQHALRIMKSYGFKVQSMWYSAVPGGLEFIYILEWPDEATMQKQWELFMADEEWTKIKQESREKYGEMVLGKLKDQVLATVKWES